MLPKLPKKIILKNLCLVDYDETINKWNTKLTKYDEIAQTKGLSEKQQQEKDWVSKKFM